jgi:hypothetical protein
MKSVQASVKPV